MARKKRDTTICPKCGTKVEPIKTWQLVSPMPDSKGRITITIMGSFQCPNCGHKWRGVVSKIKVGGDEIEVGGKKIKEAKPVKEEPEVIELDLDEIDVSDEEIEKALKPK